MKRYVPKRKEETTSEIGEICGFIDNEGVKGYLVYVGSNKDDNPNNELHAVSSETLRPGLEDSVPNPSYGGANKNIFYGVEDFVRRGLQDCINSVSEIYFFESQKELHRWLAEDYLGVRDETKEV